MHTTEHTTRVTIIIDIKTTPTIAYTLARARLHETINKLNRHGHTATAIRIDINNTPYPNP